MFFSKRAPQQRDLVSRPYGRFHHLPRELARLGNQVTVVLLDAFLEAPETPQSGPDYERICARIRSLSARSRVAQIVDTHRPDWIIGCSDAWVGVVAHWASRRIGAGLVIDAYDNYESYMPWNKPLHLLWRRAIGAADVLSVAGPQLGDLLGRHSGVRPTIVPMAADPNFVPMARQTCREELGLPAEGRLLGYAGSWGAARGTRLIIESFRMLRQQDTRHGLVLTGRPPSEVLTEPGVISLGYVADSALPGVLNAMDGVCVVTANTAFGRYSYPSKLCEAMACNLPVAATDTAPVRWMLGENSAMISPLDDPTAYASKAREALALGRHDYGPLASWTQSARLLQRALDRTLPEALPQS
jgi:glycosyltransferase involved in cell wall biosynthesis